MADNYLERHYEEYEARKREWLRKGKHPAKPSARRTITRPDDEAL